MTNDQEEKSRLSKFRCSYSWVGTFKKNHSIRKQSINGMEDSLDPTKVMAERSKIQQAVIGYEPKDIFNADETGLFFRGKPRSSLVAGSLSCKEHVQSKERLTILLCCSAIGEKLKPLVIGKYERPRALKSISKDCLPCLYGWNKNAWITRQIFGDWLQEINESMVLKQRFICLIVDNFSGHTSVEHFSNIKIVYLTPGMTSVLQPLDCGIINSLKARYKREVVDHYLEQMDEEISKAISIKKAIDFIAKAWDDLTVDIIINCWRHADVIGIEDLLNLACLACMEG
jgi:hypothetical protein